MKIRPATGLGTLLADAMNWATEVADREELLAYLQEHYWFWGPIDENVTIEKYGDGIDKRCGWDTYLICVDGKAALYSDGPLEP